MKHANLLTRSRSLLVLIDVQQKLCDAMPETLATMVQHCRLLLQVAKRLEVPILVTEQYPQGLGSTLPELQVELNTASLMEKISFSCCRDNNFQQRLLAEVQTGRNQVVLMGMEAHICVLQTALDLHAIGVQAFVVEDAVISRCMQSQVNALRRLEQQGITITNAESAIFEWMEAAQGTAFKEISRLLK